MLRHLPSGNFLRSKGARLFLLAVLTTSCGPGSGSVEEAARKKSEGTGEPAMLWSIPTSGGTKLLLAGSLHILGPEDHPLPRILLDSLDACEVLITESGAAKETRVEVANFIRERGMLPAGDRLGDRLGSGVGELLSDYYRRKPDARSLIESLRPWLASLRIGVESFRAGGMEPSLGVEATLLERAAGRGMRIEALESPTVQMSALADLRWEEEERLLGEVLGKVSDGTALLDYLELKKAWRNGDLEAVEKHIEQVMAGGTGSLEVRLLSERNLRFTERICELVEAPPGETADVFVLVGAGHLPGSGGVLALLAQRLAAPPVRLMPGGGGLEVP